jgi:hypothetical protein
MENVRQAAETSSSIQGFPRSFCEQGNDTERLSGRVQHVANGIQKIESRCHE